MIELADLTVSDAAARIRRRELSARVLVDSVLERANQTESVVHAYSALNADSARAAADAADAAQDHGDALGPLHGVPIAVDDLLDVRAGVMTAPSTDGTMPAGSGTAAARILHAAGAILLGRTWTHELGLATGVPPTRNSWDPRRAPGGSSAGSAVAVAVGSATAAIGVDTGGSVRIPAALNGVVGYTPTQMTVESTPSRSLDSVGLLSRSARDSLLMYDVLSGRAPIDSNTALSPEDLGTYLIHSVSLEVIGSPSPAVGTVVEQALAVFVAGGVEHTPVDWPHPGLAAAAGRTLATVHAASRHRPSLSSRWFELEPATVAHLVAGAALPAPSRRLAERLRRVVSAELDAILRPERPTTTPILALPTFPIAPGPAHDLFAGYAAARPLARETQMLASLAGLPAVTLPCDLGAEKMPAGLQLIGPRGSDRALLRLAIWFQQHTEWHEQSPLRQPVYDDDLEQDELAAPRS